MYGGFRDYAAGAPVRFEDFPPVSIGLEDGGPRFRRLQTSTEGRPLYVHPGELYDSTIGGVCQPQDLSGDGRTFCVGPYAVVDVSTPDFGPYADASCTSPLVVVSDTCPGTEPLIARMSSPSGACGGTPVFRRILGAHAGPTYSTSILLSAPSVQRRCARDEESGGVAHDIGGELDPATMFPPLTAKDL